jgi:hypothetical protein
MEETQKEHTLQQEPQKKKLNRPQYYFFCCIWFTRDFLKGYPRIRILLNTIQCAKQSQHRRQYLKKGFKSSRTLNTRPIETPTPKRKNGITKSASVTPNHGE